MVFVNLAISGGYRGLRPYYFSAYTPWFCYLSFGAIASLTAMAPFVLPGWTSLPSWFSQKNNTWSWWDISQISWLIFIVCVCQVKAHRQPTPSLIWLDIHFFILTAPPEDVKGLTWFALSFLIFIFQISCIDIWTRIANSTKLQSQNLTRIQKSKLGVSLFSHYSLPSVFRARLIGVWVKIKLISSSFSCWLKEIIPIYSCSGWPWCHYFFYYFFLLPICRAIRCTIHCQCWPVW